MVKYKSQVEPQSIEQNNTSLGRYVGRERERFIPSHNIIKICYQNHCALQMLDSRSNMVITDLLPGAPLMFLLAILAAHPVYISV